MTMLSGLKITLLVTGSIAAYKAAELVRELRRHGVRVRVAMSHSATEFITPLTLQTLSQNPVSTNLLSPEQEEVGHIRLADDADIVLVAPATANIIAKAAIGIADNLPSAILLATKAPVVFAPAMNVNMWESPATQENLSTLKARGALFVQPGVGELACGWTGTGRFAENDHIIDVLREARSPKDLLSRHVVVTAGGTQEPIDPVRYLSNRSSGKMGYALAQVARNRGAQVTLISGPTTLLPPTGVSVQYVETALEMKEALATALLQENLPENITEQLVFMVAAIADYRPAEFSEEKIKRESSLQRTLLLEANPDILAELGATRESIQEKSGRALKLVGFAAETGEQEDLLYWTKEKLEKKQVDLMVGNFAKEALGSDTNRVWLIDRAGKEQEFSTADKESIADRILTRTMKLS